MNTLRQLELWFQSQCDGDWEHEEGIKIYTLDNPGWGVDIALLGTNLENQQFPRVQIERNATDWLWIFLKDEVFSIRCGPLNLDEGLQEFIKWATS